MAQSCTYFLLRWIVFFLDQMESNQNISSNKTSDEFPIYLDYNATTPLDPRVAQSMSSLLVKDSSIDAVMTPELCWGNCSSAHIFGMTAKKSLEKARQEVSNCIKAETKDEIVFTSGGTESINQAIKGSCFHSRNNSKLDSEDWKNHIVTSAIEHEAVFQTINYLCEHFGFSKSVVSVDSFGCVIAEDVLTACTKRTILVSIMLANNEVGSVQPIKKICKLVKKDYPNILIHTDASQAIGKIPVNVKELGVDMLTLAGHKFYGPKGIGALFISRSSQHLVDKLIHGASHEINRRAGTENVLLAVGLGKACSIALGNLKNEIEHQCNLRDSLQELLLSKCVANDISVCINGNLSNRLPNTLSITFNGFSAAEIVNHIQHQIACSTRSACHSISSNEKSQADISRVLDAMSISKAAALGTLRLSVGRFTTIDDIERASTLILKALQNIKAANSNPKNIHIKENENSINPTVLEYFEDTYIFRSNATVLQVEESPNVPFPQKSSDNDSNKHKYFDVILDKTIFHPIGGGQPSDIGEMFNSIDSTKFIMEFCKKDETSHIVHHYGKFVGKPFQVGIQIEQRVNSEYREYNARVHSAGHLIDAAMIKCGIDHLRPTKGFHFPNIGPSVEYSGTVPPDERIALKKLLEDTVNELINMEIPTEQIYQHPEKHDEIFQSKDTSRHLKNPCIRMISIGGLSHPCGGTHVNNTKQIKQINIRKISSKKGNLKVSYDVPI